MLNLNLSEIVTIVPLTQHSHNHILKLCSILFHAYLANLVSFIVSMIYCKRHIYPLVLIYSIIDHTLEPFSSIIYSLLYLLIYPYQNLLVL